MDITWLGHSCFRIKGKEAIVITDPFAKDLGYSLGRPSANIVTVSHPHPQHSFVQGVGGTPKVVSRPGEYEVSNVFINGIVSFHDAEGGKRLGKNTIFVIDIDEVKVCHLGDLGHVLSPEQMEEISDADILLVPVGGGSTLDATAAAETVRLLEPGIVIPMHFRTEAVTLQLDLVDRFLKEMGVKDKSQQPRLSLTRSTLPTETQVVILDYRH